MKPLPRLFNLTRYDLLCHYGGEAHATHSVARKLKTPRKVVVICSCDAPIELPNEPEVEKALASVPDASVPR